MFEDNSRIKVIGESAFEETDLRAFTIAPSVTTIGYGAFFNCNKLKTLELYRGETYNSLGSAAFFRGEIVYITREPTWAPSSPPTNVPTNSTSLPSAPSSTRPPWSILGVICGSIGGVVFVLGLYFICYRRNRVSDIKQQEEYELVEMDFIS